MTTREEAARLADALLEAVVLDKHMMQAAALLRQWPDAAAQEPVAWREHVEQRIRTWRQSTMNRSGDRLAIDDFMGQDSIDDLVDFVCDVYAAPPAAQPAGMVLVPREPHDDEVICPNCCTQFRAIPVNVQNLMLDAGFEPPFTHPASPAQPAAPAAKLVKCHWCSGTGIDGEQCSDGYHGGGPCPECKGACWVPDTSQPPAPAVEPLTDESAWLIEWQAHGHGPQWWGFNHTPGLFSDWCSDANNAIRFSRKEDAERMRLHVIAVAGFSGRLDYQRQVTVTEHMWPAAHGVTQGEQQ